MKKNSLYLSLLLTFVLGMTACGSDNSTNASVENPVLGTNSSSSGSGASNKNDSRIGSFYNPAITYGQLVDARDGNVYRTVQIGSQVWMAENLKYKVENAWNLDICQGREDACAKYGRTYYTKEAMTACPVGWHLPSIDEWNTLYSVVGENPYALVAKGWNSGVWQQGTDDYGLSIVPCLRCYNEDAWGSAYMAIYWISMDSHAGMEGLFNAHCFQITSGMLDEHDPYSSYLYVKIDTPIMYADQPLSVRCVKD